MDKIMYRSEDSYGSGVRDILDVMTYEIYELKNIDIPDYILNNYLQNTNIQGTVEKLVDDVEAFDEEEVYKICKLMIKEINKQTDHDLKYALWLADKSVVLDMYAYDSLNVDAYETSDIILSNLGADGVLFAYDYEPEPINE